MFAFLCLISLVIKSSVGNTLSSCDFRDCNSTDDKLVQLEGILWISLFIFFLSGWLVVVGKPNCSFLNYRYRMFQKTSQLSTTSFVLGIGIVVLLNLGRTLVSS